MSELLLDAGGCGWRGDEFHAPGLHLRARIEGLVFELGPSGHLRHLSWPLMGSAGGWGGSTLGDTHDTRGMGGTCLKASKAR